MTMGLFDGFNLLGFGLMPLPAVHRLPVPGRGPTGVARARRAAARRRRVRRHRARVRG